MPSAMMMIAIAVNPGFLIIVRSAKRISRIRLSISKPPVKGKRPAAAPQGKRQKAKGKRQKWRMNHGVSLLVGKAAAILFLPFAFCLLPCGVAASFSPEVINGIALSGHSLRYQDAGQEPASDAGGNRLAGAWHQRQHGNL